MITVTFVQPNGDEYTYDAEVGDTLMDVAVDNAVDDAVDDDSEGFKLT